ncbi:HAD hydrolase family protein [Demequina sp.]|uniref:HAD hydrolase family protein n=1 Tax=Demequina sp. TaxID=2050685 RepID=UPI003D148871
MFLDVDGTYALHGRVPDAHVGAVRAARAAGHKVFLCTGRPVSALPQSLTGAGFDGYVCAAGAYVEIGGETIADVDFPAPLAAALLAELDAHGVDYIVENAHELLLPRTAKHLMTRALGAYGGENAEVLIEVVDSFTGIPVTKVICFGGDRALTEIIQPLGPDVAVVANSIEDLGRGAGEVFQAHINKAVGIAAAITELGIDRDDVFAFGDGLNDLEMLEFAGVSVAIEGSDPRVLAAADHVIPGPERAGLASAFHDLGLIA